MVRMGMSYRIDVIESRRLFTRSVGISQLNGIAVQGLRALY